jgi:hypothetical protein
LNQNEYATLVYYWRSEPHPERIPEILTAFRDCSWAHVPPRDLPMAGALLAFETLYPDLKQTWRAEFPAVYRFAARATRTDKDADAWNDYHIAQWFLTRDLACLDAVLDRVASGGEVGYAARRTLESWAERCIPFRRALLKAQAARRAAMVIQ